MPVPHTRPIGVTVSGNRTELIESLSVWRPRTQVPANALHLRRAPARASRAPTPGFVLLVPHYLADTEFPDAAVAALSEHQRRDGTDLPDRPAPRGGPRLPGQGRRAGRAATTSCARLVATLEERHDTYMEGNPLPSPLTDQDGEVPSRRRDRRRAREVPRHPPRRRRSDRGARASVAHGRGRRPTRLGRRVNSRAPGSSSGRRRLRLRRRRARSARSLGVAGGRGRARFDVSASTLSTLGRRAARRLRGAADPGRRAARPGRAEARCIAAGARPDGRRAGRRRARAADLGVAVVGAHARGRRRRDDLHLGASGCCPSWFRGPHRAAGARSGSATSASSARCSRPSRSRSCCTARAGRPAFLGAAASRSSRSSCSCSSSCATARPGRAATPRPTWRDGGRQLGESVRRPGTRLGFWSHFVTQSSGTVFSLLWGVPVPGRRARLGPTAGVRAAHVLVASGVVAGPVLGLLTARFPLRRSNLVLGIVTVMGVAWTRRAAWPGRPPHWLASCCSSSPRHRRARLADRVRLRAHLQPAAQPRRRQRHRQRRRASSRAS